MTTLKRIFLLLVVAACVGAAGCGSDDEGGKQIPAGTAAALQAELNGVQARLDNGTPGACKDILEGPRGPNRDGVQELLDGLPNEVDPDVRESLQESFDNLWNLVESKCEDLTPEEPAQTETTPPEPTPTETETQPTETTPPATETTPTTPDEVTPPPDGHGNGNDGAIPPDGTGNGGGVGPGAAKQKKEKGK